MSGHGHEHVSVEKKHGRRFSLLAAVVAAYLTSFTVSAGEKALFDLHVIRGPIMGHSRLMPEGSRHPDFLPDLGTTSTLVAFIAAWMWCRRPDRPHGHGKHKNGNHGHH